MAAAVGAALLVAGFTSGGAGTDVSAGTSGAATAAPSPGTAVVMASVLDVFAASVDGSPFFPLELLVGGAGTGSGGASKVSVGGSTLSGDGSPFTGGFATVGDVAAGVGGWAAKREKFGVPRGRPGP